MDEPELIFNEDDYNDGEDPYGLRLHLPEQMIERCEDEFWTITDECVKRNIEDRLSSQEGCFEWCHANISADLRSRNKQREFAYALLIINKENYMLPYNFCKAVELDRVLATIKRGSSLCAGFDFGSKAYRYIKTVHWLIVE